MPPEIFLMQFVIKQKPDYLRSRLLFKRTHLHRTDAVRSDPDRIAFFISGDISLIWQLKNSAKLQKSHTTP